MIGLLNVNKPAGYTSRELVDQVQHATGQARAGHAGTLDPLATGVVVVALGRATRLIGFIQQLSKQYRATFLWGQRSPSDDVDGLVEPLPDAPRPSHDEIVAQLPALTGTIQQVPPAYSAIKVRGQRAYRLARQGKPVQLAARPVVVERFELVSYDYPELVVDVRCGSGTYVRALGRDLAARLGTAAVMSRLERTAIGHFRLEDAVPLDELDRTTAAQCLLPPAAAVAQLPRIVVGPPEQAELAHGRSIPNPLPETPEHVAALDDSGQLLAILQAAADGRLRPKLNFVVGGQ